MKRKKKKKKLTFQSEDLNPRFSVTFLPMIWIFMESEEPEIKSKQASKRDRTLKSRLTIQFFPPQNTRNRLRKRRAQTSNLQVLSQSNSNINKSTKILSEEDFWWLLTSSYKNKTVHDVLSIIQKSSFRKKWVLMIVRSAAHLPIILT